MSDTRHLDPGGQQRAWRRWEMDELGAPQAESERHLGPTRDDPEAERRRKERQRRQADLDALREQAMQEGRDAGYQEGLEAGHREGLAKGLEEGRQQARQELEARKHELLAPLGELAQQFSSALDTLDEVIAEDLADLALETGRKLAGEALEERPDQVLEVVRALLHTDPPLLGQQRLWLHPQDHALVEKHLGEELSAAGWALQPDDQISRGGCRVTSASGELDATWERRWQAIEAQVRRRSPQAPGQRAVSTGREEEHS
ncbi:MULTISPECIES: flagellar assembly protein FliH [unclassified Halomonas]|uniref:flagellar assembly protein FliH n=1 Tax=unclassified Halomonas TaxID=2609666 RepID=UPI0028856B4B|nr:MULTISPECIES: flagellar assembly protein FliH [unclassified Halomonas]MDT0500501.1 flagellar assembly protein FliH [Halomonas sp. PAR7]MDT0511603.1 flagellar assembly protein FliH [Halomonas sp. LES1]MDT0590109.1 flagellar assembly protein FliH [Halomonas sp. PAR8]